MVLLAVLGVTCEEEVVIVEVSELAVEQTVTLQLLSRRENAATFGALRREKERERRRRLNFLNRACGIETRGAECVFKYLIDEKRCHKFPWFEDIHHLTDELVVGCLGEVGFKADVRELWLGGDVNRPVSSLEKQDEMRSNGACGRGEADV